MMSLPPGERAAALAELSPNELEALSRTWSFVARDAQLAPGTEGAADPRTDWTFWLCLAGRGWGKTRSGAEWSTEKARAMPGSHGALVAATSDDCRKVMLSSGLEGSEGASGILAISAADFRPLFEPSKRILTWPNGTVATLYSAEEPDRLRGPAHHWGWVDEIAAWAAKQDAWDQFLFGLRHGEHPQACITTTPRPLPLLRRLLADPGTVVSRGTTRENRANLAPSFYANIVGRYEGTRLGRQELDAELLEDNPGALWSLARIDELRVRSVPQLRRVVVAIDPAVSTGEDSDETGIVVAGTGPCYCLGGAEEQHGFVIGDASGKYTPLGWAKEAVALYRRNRADKIVAEINNGGDLVEANLRTVERGVSYKKVTASRGKRIRAEPIAGLYEQGKVHHLGAFPLLEDQLTMWDPGSTEKSPDRLDALVWALTELMGEGMMAMDYDSHRDRIGPSRWGDDRRLA